MRAARAHHRGGRRTRPVLPGQRPGRLSAQTNPRGGRRNGPVPPRRLRPRHSAEAALLRRRRVTPPLPKGRTRPRCWPTLLHRVSQGLPHFGWRPRSRRSIGRARRYCGAAVGARGTVGWRPRRRRSIGRARRCRAAAVAASLHCRMAPAQVACPSGRARRGRVSRSSAGGASADGFSARAGVPGSPVATSAPRPVLSVSSDGGPSDASAGAAAHTPRDSVHSRHQSPPRRHIPAAVRRHVWLRDGGRCCYRDPLTGRRCTSSHLLQIDHLLPVAQGGGPEPDNLELACFAHHRMRHGHGPGPPPEPPM